MKKYIFTLLFMTCIGFLGYGQSNSVSQNQTADYVAIENQAGIQVSYVYDNAENPQYFFVKITNISTTKQTVEYTLLNNADVKLSESYAPLNLEAGESFIGNDITMAIPVNSQTKLSNYSTTITIKK